MAAGCLIQRKSGSTVIVAPDRPGDLRIRTPAGGTVVARTVHPYVSSAGTRPLAHDEAIRTSTGDSRSLATARRVRFLCDTDYFHTIVEGVIAPGVRVGAPPALSTAFVVGDGRLGVGRTGKL